LHEYLLSAHFGRRLLQKQLLSDAMQYSLFLPQQQADATQGIPRVLKHCACRTVLSVRHPESTAGREIGQAQHFSPVGKMRWVRYAGLATIFQQRETSSSLINTM